MRDRLLIALVVVFVVYSALYLQAFSTLPLAMAADGLGTGTYGAVIALNGLVIVVVQPLAARALGAFDRGRMLGVAMLLVGLGFGLGAVAHTGAAYATSVLVWTAGEIGVAVMFGATFADLAPADLRGGYLGLAGSTWSLGSVFGPLAGTALLDWAGGTTLWASCAATGVALLAVQWALAPALRRRHRREISGDAVVDAG
jgi:MFS family permease